MSHRLTHQLPLHHGWQIRAQMWSQRPKWDKSGTFSDQISEHFGALRQNVLKSDLKKSQISPIWG